MHTNTGLPLAVVVETDDGDGVVNRDVSDPFDPAKPIR